MFVIVQNASLPRGHASIRIQQYVGIITCMGLVLLRDREECTCITEQGHCSKISAPEFQPFQNSCPYSHHQVKQPNERGFMASNDKCAELLGLRSRP